MSITQTLVLGVCAESAARLPSAFAPSSPPRQTAPLPMVLTQLSPATVPGSWLPHVRDTTSGPGDMALPIGTAAPERWYGGP